MNKLKGLVETGSFNPACFLSCSAQPYEMKTQHCSIMKSEEQILLSNCGTREEIFGLIGTGL